ncbi:MAG: flavodoxin-dependent (E)-4-hydroxy-3-methylbut-2-enyl-diphosphate synthase, partial [Bacteroidales bacterium]|nr:flavodoxin-dependent (E)-4-hydroxy-3-methylbut-2-enyl-diphosphate synthase [Bacteroidales bacterium]
DIEHFLAIIKSKTSHLKGLKIAVMGCIVNGPGEMADADYGFVGCGNGKITLYKAQTPVLKQIDEATAVDALIELIKSNGDWVECPPAK